MVILGTQYAGEMKKGVFTIMNYKMPKDGLLSLHSSANQDPQTGETTLFFGLSGTGSFFSDMRLSFILMLRENDLIC